MNEAEFYNHLNHVSEVVSNEIYRWRLRIFLEKQGFSKWEIDAIEHPIKFIKKPSTGGIYRQEARKLYNKHYPLVTGLTDIPDEIDERVIDCCRLSIELIIQNSDQDAIWWGKVKKELKKL